MSTFYHGDIHQIIQMIPSRSIDMIYVNPPFGITEAEWDKPLYWEMLFPECFRVLKENGALVIHCSIPFTYDLIRIRKPKYHYTWKKDNPTTFFLAKRQPMRINEEILVYYDKQPTYNPQMIGTEIRTNRMTTNSQYYGKNRLKCFTPKEPHHIQPHSWTINVNCEETERDLWI